MSSAVQEKGDALKKDKSLLRNSKTVDAKYGGRNDFDSVIEEVLSGDVAMSHLRQVMLLVKTSGTDKWGPFFEKVIWHVRLQTFRLLIFW